MIGGACLKPRCATIPFLNKPWKTVLDVEATCCMEAPGVPGSLKVFFGSSKQAARGQEAQGLDQVAVLAMLGLLL